MPTEKKKQIVEQLKNRFSQAKVAIFTDYRGLTVNELNKLRQKLAEVEAELKIAKNTLIRLALGNKKQEVVSDKLEGPTAVLFGFKDPIATIKALFEFAKERNLPKVKLGILEGQVLNAEQIEEIAKLPDRGTLVGYVINSLKLPVLRLANVLGGPQKRLVDTLKAITTERR